MHIDREEIPQVGDLVLWMVPIEDFDDVACYMLILVTHISKRCDDAFNISCRFSGLLEDGSCENKIGFIPDEDKIVSRNTKGVIHEEQDPPR